MRARLTQADIESYKHHIATCLADGLTITEAAEKLGINPVILYRFIIKHLPQFKGYRGRAAELQIAARKYLGLCPSTGKFIRRVVPSGCRYYLARDRRLCGAPTHTKNYCENHDLKTAPIAIRGWSKGAGLG